MTIVLASAADRRYGWWLLNLVGSVYANSRANFDRIVLYDLGLSSMQRRLAESIRGAELRSVPPFAPHWSQSFTWKPWIWTNVDATTVVYLDAGLTVLRSLDAVVAGIEEHGYFVVSQGKPLADIVPDDYWEPYGVPRELGEREYVAAGIIGFRKDSLFYERVIEPTFADCLAGRNLGFSREDADGLNAGRHRTDDAVARQARRFRHDQSVLNLRLFSAFRNPVVADLDRFGGYRSDRDHADQVIWNHRRRGDLRYLGGVPYRRPLRAIGTLLGLIVRARWWLRLHRWMFRPSTYIGKARRVMPGLGGGSPR